MQAECDSYSNVKHCFMKHVSVIYLCAHVYNWVMTVKMYFLVRVMVKEV